MGVLHHKICVFIIYYVHTTCVFLGSTQRPDMLNKNSLRPDNKSKRDLLHRDNAPVHTASSMQFEINVLGILRQTHPPYSPDLVTWTCVCFFWKFSCRKLQ